MMQKLCATRDVLRDHRISGVSDIRGEERPVFPEDHPTGKKRHSSKKPPVTSSKFPRLENTTPSLNDPLPNEPELPYSPSLAPSPIEVPTDAETEVFDSDQEMLLENLDPSVPEIFLNEHEQNDNGNKQEDPQDYERFKQAIQKEWKTNLDNGAIGVIEAAEAMRIRQKLPHRIMQSRLLHVAKPIDDLSQIDQSQILNCSPSGVPCKAKTRWVARGD